MTSSRVIVDLDSKQELIIPDTLPDVSINTFNENNQWSNKDPDINTSFLSNFITNMNLELKEPNIEMPDHAELYRVESPEPVYHPNTVHNIFRVDQMNRNVYYNENHNNIPNMSEISMGNSIIEYNISTSNLQKAFDKLSINEINSIDSPKFNEINLIDSPKFNEINLIDSPKINEVISMDTPKKRRGRPKKLFANFETCIISKLNHYKKNNQIFTESGVITDKQNVVCSAFNKKHKGIHSQKNSISDRDPMTLISVPSSQELKTFSVECDFEQEKPIPKIKYTRENIYDFQKSNYRFSQPLSEPYTLQLNFTDFPIIRKRFSEKFPLLMNHLNWDPKAINFNKYLKSYRYQNNLDKHVCHNKELIHLSTNNWNWNMCSTDHPYPMCPNKSRKIYIYRLRKNRKNNFIKEKEAEKLSELLYE